jgi:hypothetical protein
VPRSSAARFPVPQFSSTICLSSRAYLSFPRAGQFHSPRRSRFTVHASRILHFLATGPDLLRVRAAGAPSRRGVPGSHRTLTNQNL